MTILTVHYAPAGTVAPFYSSVWREEFPESWEERRVTLQDALLLAEETQAWSEDQLTTRYPLHDQAMRIVGNAFGQSSARGE